MNRTLVGTSRYDVPARAVAGGTVAPLNAARTAQRAVPTCERQLMRLTGESPSSVETCDNRVPERNCAVARRGGKQREGNCPAQKCIPMQLNSIRLLHQASPRRKGEAGSPRVSVASTRHVQERTTGDAGEVGVSGAGKFINGPLRAALVLEGSSAAVRVSIVALEHGKAV